MTIDVLIAEDDLAVQKLYEHEFNKRNANAIIVGNLESAVEAAKGKKFDLYITDGAYPENSNYSSMKRDICYDFYQKIKETNPDAKIIVISTINYNVPSEKAPDMINLSKSDFYQGIDKLLETMGVKK